MRILITLLALCASAYAQSDVWKYSKSATLSGAATAFTVSLPPTGSRQQAEILDFTLQCTADCTVSTERNGSAPTATLGTWRPEDLDSAPKSAGTPVQPVVRIYHSSDSTGGSTMDEPYLFPANAIVPWGLGTVVLTGIGATTNVTIRLATFTGTYHFQIRVRIRR